MGDPRRWATLPLTLFAAAEFALLENLAALRSYKHFCSFHPSGVPVQKDGTLLTASVEPARIRLGFDFSPRFLCCYHCRKQTQTQPTNQHQESFLHSHLLSR